MSDPPGEDDADPEGDEAGEGGQGGKAGKAGEADEAGEVPDSVQDELRDHPWREAILDLLDDRPGMNKNQICVELGLDSHHVDHHLDQLENRGQLVVTRESAQDKEVLCFLAEDEELWKDENTRILFGRRQKRAVALLLADEPGASTREIAERLRLSPDTVRYHLRTLMAHDLVERHRTGQTNVYEPAQALRRWAREVGGGFERPWEG